MVNIFNVYGGNMKYIVITNNKGIRKYSEGIPFPLDSTGAHFLMADNSCLNTVSSLKFRGIEYQIIERN